MVLGYFKTHLLYPRLTLYGPKSRPDSIPTQILIVHGRGASHLTLGIWVSATSTLTGRPTCFIKEAVVSAHVVISPYVVLVVSDVLFHFLFLFNPFFRFSSGVLTLISGALLLAELKLSAVLSSKFSHDSTGGWGGGGC